MNMVSRIFQFKIWNEKKKKNKIAWMELFCFIFSFDWTEITQLL